MKIKTSELSGAALDWAVAYVQFPEPEYERGDWVYSVTHPDPDLRYSPSTNWKDGGPIIQWEGIRLCMSDSGRWDAELCEFNTLEQGSSPLIAAMRCYVSSRLGNEVDVPDELQA